LEIFINSVYKKHHKTSSSNFLSNTLYN